MSVSATTSKIVYTGSGTTGPFDFDFRIFESSDLVVEKFTIATGATVTLTETTDYSVTIDPDGTGYVTAVAAVTSAYKLIIRRVLPLTQEIDYVEGDNFPAETHEEGLDRGRMVDQQLQEQIDRAVLQNPTVSTQITLPGAVEGSLLGWEGGTIVNKTASDLSAVTKATQAVAEAGTDDTTYMTPLQVKNEVQKSGALFIPIENIATGTPNGSKFVRDDSTLQEVIVPVKATGAEIDTGTDDAKFATAKAIADSALVSEGTLTDYSATSTIVGLASFTTKKIILKQIGLMMHVWWVLAGTSDATTVSFTVPKANAGGLDVTIALGYAVDNGSQLTTGTAQLANTASTITCLRVPAATAWTNSGVKEVDGYMCYPVAS